MFRIRRIFDDSLPVDRAAVAQVQEILAAQFPDVSAREVRDIPAKLRNPLKYRFRTVLLVAESRNRVRGFALVMHVPDVGFCYLDYLCVAKGLTGGGVGAALYQQVRHESRFLGAGALLYECPPDHDGSPLDKRTLRKNRARTRFYERFGASVVLGTAYETPLTPDSDPAPPMLVYDPLAKGRSLRRDFAKACTAAILERKYAGRCSEEYVRLVLDSFKSDPVRLREPDNLEPDLPEDPAGPAHAPLIPMAVNDRHDIHHVRERGYVESPARITRILGALEDSGQFTRLERKRYPDKWLTAVHDREMADYFKRVCAGLPPEKSIYPYVFPIRNRTRPPKELPVRAGYYCIDTFTPLNANAYLAARRAVDCALAAAERLVEGDRLAYALIRPPGHHAERAAFGGFCYFNNAAVAANYLASFGKVAVLDIDYHHGNGTQEIFYQRPDVFTASIHGHPKFAYPYFSGFADERGEGPGLRHNLNMPLPELVDGREYAKALDKALHAVHRTKPVFLVLSLGLDTAKGDPTGTWLLEPRDFEANGLAIGTLGLPTLVVQEGGYKIPSLGRNAAYFFKGLRKGMHGRTLERNSK